MRGGAAVLARLEQAGSAKAIVLPGPEVVFLNTSGGLTGGDRLSYALDLPEGACVTATTQTAERLYRSAGGVARIAVRARVARGARLDWLPQETILFDCCKAHRRTTVELSQGASCLLLEALVLGRAAMGEQVRACEFRDSRMIRREGRPLHLEPLALDAARLAPGPAGLAGARALASVVFVSGGAEDALAPLRATLDEPGVRAAASGFDGRLVVRLMADDGLPLRRQILRLLAVLRAAPLPRVWQN